MTESLGTTFQEDFHQEASPHFEYRNRGASSILSPTADAGSLSAVRLTLPAGCEASPDEAPQLQTEELFGYGHYEVRLKTADCSAHPLAGVVTGYFTYFNDRVTDSRGIGLPDNSEIDFEWLGAEPHVIILSLWTHYRAEDCEQRRVSRAIDLRTGQVLYTHFFPNFGLKVAVPLTGVEAFPSAVTPLPEYDSSAAYHEYGFTWAPDRVTWWMVHPKTGDRLLLWDYQGPEDRIPHLPARYMANVWHTPGWGPLGRDDAVERPRVPVSLSIDWMKYTSLA